MADDPTQPNPTEPTQDPNLMADPAPDNNQPAPDPDDAPAPGAADPNAPAPGGDPAPDDKNAKPEDKKSTEEPNLLKDENHDAAKKTAAEPPSAEAVSEWVDGFDDAKLENGQVFGVDRAVIEILAPDLVALGITQEQATGVFQKFIAHQTEQLNAFEESQRQVIQGMADAAREKFGADLPKMLTDAKRGGAAIFGSDLWGELSSIPAFSNDARIIEALANHGRTLRSDKGVGGNSKGTESGDFERAWIESSNRPKD